MNLRETPLSRKIRLICFPAIISSCHTLHPTLRIEYDNEDDWEELGTAIGRNTFLTEVILRARNIPAIKFRDFVRGLAFNRSIRKLSIASCNLSNDVALDLSQETWNHLTLFFINNKAFECLELELRWNMVNHRELISVKEFKLSKDRDHRYDNASADDVIDALIEHHTGLRKLTIQGFCMGRTGCSARQLLPSTNFICNMVHKFMRMGREHSQLALQGIPHSRN